MQIPRYKPYQKLGFNMTPMIDVVFLLIIFFLVSSHLAKQETQVELELPHAVSAADDSLSDKPRLTININADGSYSLAGRPIAADRLAEQFARVKEKEGGEVEVRIRGSRAATWSTAEPVMIACTRAGIWDVRWAVYRESR